jgi:hypothetical protein
VDGGQLNLHRPTRLFRRRRPDANAETEGYDFSTGQFVPPDQKDMMASLLPPLDQRLQLREAGALGAALPDLVAIARTVRDDHPTWAEAEAEESCSAGGTAATRGCCWRCSGPAGGPAECCRNSTPREHRRPSRTRRRWQQERCTGRVNRPTGHDGDDPSFYRLGSAHSSCRAMFLQ